MGLTRRQKKLVQQTWGQIVPISETAAGMFYSRLFEIDPDLESLFPAEERAMREQGRKLMWMITLAVRGLDRPDELLPAVEDLGRRHATYGVREKDYASVGAALLWTLEQGLGESFTPEVEDALAATYGLLANVMQDGATREEVRGQGGTGIEMSRRHATDPKQTNRRERPR